MSRTYRCIAALGAVFFVIIGLAACGGVPGDAVVSVNGNAVTKATFAHWMNVAAASSATTETGGKAPVPEPPDYTACIAHLQATSAATKGKSAPSQSQLKSECEQQYKSLLQEVLGFLISSEWVLGEASSLGVKVSDKEVEKRFEQIKSEQFPKASEFEKFLASSGQTVSDLLLRVKLNLLSTKIQQKIIKSKGTVTKAQIAKYYSQNPEHFGTPAMRGVQLILTKGEAEAKKAKSEIESGKSFASVAKRVSIDPTTRAHGGSLTVTKGEEEKSLDAAIFSAPKNVLSGPVKTVFGYYVFNVASVKPGTRETLAQAEASIKQQLTATNQQEALSKFVKEFRKRWTSKTECRSGFVVTDCKQYKAPKTTTTTK